ncbi:class I SAM-dependent methyltransferase [Candidatus Woesearchaeota archaeon]|nr:class I SAM-dependent methyltransferase [Candidatus Woesearchaeota archaeon]
MIKHSFKELNLENEILITDFMRTYSLTCETVYYNIQKSYSTGQKEVPVLNFLMQTDNHLLLGKDDSFYRKYRYLRSEFRKTFNMKRECTFTTLGQMTNSIEEIPLGVHIGEICDSSENWLQQIRMNYGTNYFLKTKDDYIIGPEEALILTVKEAIKNSGAKRLLELGAGTGEVSAHAMRSFSELEVFVNEVSKSLTDHLSNYISLNAEKTGNKSNLLVGDAKDIIIPEVDVVCSGIFYGELPALIKEKGKEIAQKIKDGVFIIQSGMLENLFSLLVIDPEILPEIRLWPWYDNRMNLRNLFSEVNHFYLCGEMITLASQNRLLNEKIINSLSDKTTTFELGQYEIENR